MAPQSVRTVAQNCLGLTPPFSVNSDVYGYIFTRDRRLALRAARQPSDILPGTNTATDDR